MNPAQAPAAHRSEILPPIGGEAAPEPADASAIATAGVLHDLGNLIQITASAINILAHTPDMPATHTGPILHRARTALDHAGAIVRQNIGRIREQAERRSPRSDVVDCLADVAALVAVMDEPTPRLELVVEPELPAIACDPVALRRALLNLIFNARDAMRGEGLVQIAARAAAPMVEFRVTDNGIGMSPAMIARVFDPFFTTKRDGLGGIGLAMVERFVRSAGGGISIESAPGVGTAVTLRLPACAPSVPHAEEANP